MNLLLSFSRQTSVRLAEVGFLLIVIAGIWLAAAQTQRAFHRLRMAVAGGLIAAAGVLLIIATHWGQFG